MSFSKQLLVVLLFPFVFSFARAGATEELEIIIWNKTKNLDGIFRVIEPALTKEEKRITVAYLKKNEIYLNQALPIVSKSENKISIGGIQLSLKKDGTIEYEGKLFSRLPDEPFDQLVQRAHQFFSKKKPNESVFFQLYLQKANAMEELTARTLTAGAAAAVFVGALLIPGVGIAYSVWTLAAIASGTGLAGGTLVYLGLKDVPKGICVPDSKYTIENKEKKLTYNFNKEAKLVLPAEVKLKDGKLEKILTLKPEEIKALESLFNEACLQKKEKQINLVADRFISQERKGSPDANGSSLEILK